MFDEIKKIVKGSGLLKAIEQVELEIFTGKLVERKVDTALIEKTESKNFDLISKGQRTQFKKGRQASFSSYEDYTEEEQLKLIEKALMCGIADAVSMVQTLRDFCADFDVTIRLDDKNVIEAQGIDGSLLEIEKKILAEVKKYE
ncbi:hypothetical protein [Aeromonas sp. 603359]|uniref:hypothetical protein n=1 Tax=Aeromonas sp. 603359 TaxID=2712046 RepID=UPI003B9E2844